MIRKKKKYQRPMKAFQTERIHEENQLKVKYGLKNKIEIWRALAKLSYYRDRAKALAKRPLEEQEVLFEKLRALGLKTDTTADVLGLQVENILDRRLTTIVVKKKLATTPKQARQMIVHKKILVHGKVVSSPGYMVPVAEEKVITVKHKAKKPKAAPEEAPVAEAEAEGDEE
jgi:small subunit ribosomal protein S4